jgi:FtsP/CotA-like multicopper oxidase with cupredoxin domain
MIFNENSELNHMDKVDDEDLDLRRKMETFHRLDAEAQKEVLEGGLKHTINGYMFGNLQGLEMRQGDRVRWYVAALGSEQDLHAAHWHGKTVVEDGRRRTDNVELLPGTMKVADMNADNPGTWMLHCHVSDHMMGGMYAYFVINPK